MLNTSPEWQSLKKHSKYYNTKFNLNTAFKTQKKRFNTLQCCAPHIRADMSKNLWSFDILQKLITLANLSGLRQKRQKLLTGSLINATENRTVDHMLWRNNALSNNPPDALQKMLKLVEKIRHNNNIDHIVHIGVGGSGLGPEITVMAMEAYKTCRQTLHFVSNIDGHDLYSKLKDLEYSRTLFIIVSKSWSTTDTLHNAQAAIEWFKNNGGKAISQHFIAISARPDLAQAMEINNILEMPKGMGGRFSIWSTVGLPLAIYLGTDNFLAFLRGGVEMDTHFIETPSAQNLPIWLGLLDVWNHTFLEMPSRCITPYHHYLRRLPAYLQQLDMESNGKRVGINGHNLPYHTVPVIWGEAGSTSQHAFFQWLHQSTHRIPVEFITVHHPNHTLTHHHYTLLANAFAQGQALMVGAQASSEQLSGHQDFPGNRPSTLLMLQKLNPTSLGALLALYEHRVFVSGIVWNINSFDQFGVELGKTLAKDLEPRFITGHTTGLDPSTAGLVDWIHNKQ